MPTVTLYPAVSGDDSIWPTGGSGWSSTSNYLTFGNSGSSRNAIRFPSVDIPQGATIVSAVITFKANYTLSANTAKCKFYGNDVDNAVAPTSGSEAEALALTEASVEWNSIPAWTNGTTYDSPDLATIIQEIINRAGWNSGNALQIVIHDNASTAYRLAGSYNQGESYKAKLVITCSQDTIVNVPAFSGQSALSMQDAYFGRLVEAPPFAAQGGIAIAGMQINLSPDALSSLSALNAGIQRQVPCPSFSGSAALQVLNICRDYLIEVPPLQGQPSLAGNPRIALVPDALSSFANLSMTGFQIPVPCPPFSGSVALQVLDIYRGYFIEITPLQAQSSLAGNTLISVSALLSAVAQLATDFQIQVPSVFNGTGQLEANATSFIDRDFIVSYLCALSSPGLPDITLPMSSFQARFRSGDPSFLSVVIPGMEHAGNIVDRANGILRVYMVKTYRDGNRIAECIGMADLDDIRIDEGTLHQSVTLSGYKTETHAAKTINLASASYRMVYQGRKRYRCQPNLYLRPGYTVVVNGETFRADVITWAIGPGTEIMEVAEE
jgi:hypothetical protein